MAKLQVSTTHTHVNVHLNLYMQVDTKRYYSTFDQSNFSYAQCIFYEAYQKITHIENESRLVPHVIL